MNHVIMAMSQVLMLVGLVIIQLGNDWMTDGWGLHPIIAGALALSCIVVPHLLFHERSTHTIED